MSASARTVLGHRPGEYSGRGLPESSAGAAAALTGWPALERYSTWLTYVCLALLLAGTAPGGAVVGNTARLLWLISVGVLVMVNVGAAFGLYIAAVMMFGNIAVGDSSSGWGSPLQRPDNFALLLLLGGLAIRIAYTRRSPFWKWSTVAVLGFVGYGLAHTVLLGLFTRSTFAWYMRAFGLPFLMYAALEHAAVRRDEMRVLIRCLLAVCAYTALFGIAERLGFAQWMPPARSLQRWNELITLYPGRSGGLPMQPAWNAYELSLMFCLAILWVQLISRRGRALIGLVSGLCLGGILFAYTRAAWLACILASAVLLLRDSGGGRSTVRRFGVLAVGAAFIVALTILPNSMIRSRVDDADTVMFRLNLWEASLTMVRDHPLIGSGFGSFGTEIANYEDDMTIGRGVNADPGTVVHNTVLSVLVELGGIGFVLYAAAVIFVVERTRVAAKRVWGGDGAVWVLTFAGVYLLQAQFIFAHDPAANQIFFGTMGAMTSALSGSTPSLPLGGSARVRRASRLTQ